MSVIATCLRHALPASAVILGLILPLNRLRTSALLDKDEMTIELQMAQ